MTATVSLHMNHKSRARPYSYPSPDGKEAHFVMVDYVADPGGPSTNVTIFVPSADHAAVIAEALTYEPVLQVTPDNAPVTGTAIAAVLYQGDPDMKEALPDLPPIEEAIEILTPPTPPAATEPPPLPPEVLDAGRLSRRVQDDDDGA